MNNLLMPTYKLTSFQQHYLLQYYKRRHYFEEKLE